MEGLGRQVMEGLGRHKNNNTAAATNDPSNPVVERGYNRLYEAHKLCTAHVHILWASYNIQISYIVRDLHILKYLLFRSSHT